MAETALVLWAVYGAGALGFRVLVHARRTGTTGLVGITSSPGSLGWLAEVAHLLALALGLAAPLLAVADVVPPIAALDRTALHVTGLALFAAGFAGVVVSQAQMADSWRIGTDPGERTELVTAGLFSVVRNPIYAALVATLLGLALLVPNVVALASVIVFVAAIEVETRVIEEPHLLRVHPESYARYAERVGRFLPGVGRIDRPTNVSSEPGAS